GREIHIPSDPSSSAFPAVWAAVTDGSELIIRDICINPTRIGFIDVLKRMGADIKIVNTRYSSGEKIGDMVVKGHRLRSTVMEGVEIPGIIDEIPILSVAAAFADGETIIRDAGELRVKETDRIAAVVEGLKALGGNVDAMEEGMIIKGPMRLHSGNVKTFGDHRIAMAFYILSKVADIDINLDDMECVDVSYPGFFKAMEALSD
ncbi:MAG TPA: 3-phosphoshikimate 1-carboxyvinyltransferase, partial [Deltaproteobacteria bacterium]|nr:3-phosphoshikimate 1-carboxyvinyltransferase [Deltaproteobacteria bacterium]